MSKILIVDDSSVVRSQLSEIISALGHTVVEAVDGADGLSKIADREIKLVFCDVNMPNMDGLTMCERIRRSENKFVKVIILTTEGSETMKARGKAAGVSGWIVKPFKQEAIVSAVRLLT